MNSWRYIFFMESNFKSAHQRPLNVSIFSPFHACFAQSARIPVEMSIHKVQQQNI